MKNVGPGVKKLDDRSTTMVFVGYEDGTKAYRVYNPFTKRLHVTRDVIFEEDRQWDWVTSGSEPERREEFVVIYDDDQVCTRSAPEPPTTEPRPASPGSGAAPGVDDSGARELDLEAGLESDADAGGHDPGAGSAAQRHPMQTRGQRGIVKPNSKYTDEDFDYSGLCLLAAEEPASVEEALDEPAWKRAMQEEMDSMRLD